MWFVTYGDMLRFPYEIVCFYAAYSSYEICIGDVVLSFVVRYPYENCRAFAVYVSDEIS